MASKVAMKVNDGTPDWNLLPADLWRSIAILLDRGTVQSLLLAHKSISICLKDVDFAAAWTAQLHCGDKNAALEKAAGRGWLQVCRELLRRGAEADHNDSSALVAAASGGHYDVAALLLGREAGRHRAHAPARDSDALVKAAGLAHVRLCKLLLLHGARANARRSTPLMAAAARGCVRTCALLLDEDLAGPHHALAQDQDSRALVVAANLLNKPLCDLLLRHGAHACAGDSAVLMAALQLREREWAAWLLQPRHHGSHVAHGSHAARADAQDSRALVLAAHEGDMLLCRLLIRSGARACARGSEALLAAVSAGNLPLCALLLSPRDAGEHHARGDDQGSAALWMALSHGNKELAELLQQHGARMDE